MSSLIAKETLSRHLRIMRYDGKSNRGEARGALTVFRIITLLLVVIALVWSLVQWNRTPMAHLEYRARGDRVKLMALILIGLVGEAARSRFEADPLVVLWSTIALAPIAFAALYFSWRLYHAYRQSSAGGAAQTTAASRSAPSRKP